MYSNRVGMASATRHLLLPDKNKSRSVSVSVKNELCDEDKKYIQSCSDMITTLDGILLDELERRTNSNYPSRFVVKWLHIPQLTFGDWKRLVDKNTNVRHSMIHFTRGELVIDCWKKNKKPKKRSRDPERYTHKYDWDLKHVDTPHKNKMKKILSDIANILECQCAVQIDKKDDAYECILTLYEPLYYQSFSTIHEQYKDQIQSTTIKIQKNNVCMTLKL